MIYCSNVHRLDAVVSETAGCLLIIEAISDILVLLVYLSGTLLYCHLLHLSGRLISQCLLRFCQQISLTKPIPTWFGVFDADRKFILFFSITQLENSAIISYEICTFILYIQFPLFWGIENLAEMALRELNLTLRENRCITRGLGEWGRDEIKM